MWRQVFVGRVKVNAGHFCYQFYRSQFQKLPKCDFVGGLVFVKYVVLYLQNTSMKANPPMKCHIALAIVASW